MPNETVSFLGSIGSDEHHALWSERVKRHSADRNPGAWAAAMTALYGPVGIHQSRCDARDVPTRETIDAFPWIAVRMAEAARRYVFLSRKGATNVAA